MKLPFTLLLILFTTVIFGQGNEENFSIEKGVWSLEADFSINSRNSDFFNESNNSSRKEFGFSISPKVGYAINKNLILGLGLGYSYSKFEIENENVQFLGTDYSRVNSIGFFPYVKKFFPVSKKLAFNLQGETSFTFSKNTFENSDNIERESKNESFFIGIRPGINFSLTKNILLEANFGSVGYSHISGEIDGVDNLESNSFAFNFSTSSLIFGMTLLL